MSTRKLSWHAKPLVFAISAVLAAGMAMARFSGDAFAAGPHVRVAAGGTDAILRTNHKGFAKDLHAAVDFYDCRFSIGFDDEKADLAVSLKTL